MSNEEIKRAIAYGLGYVTKGESDRFWAAMDDSEAELRFDWDETGRTVQGAVGASAWGNGKLTITVPLDDVTPDSTPQEKAEAASRRLGPIDELIDDQDAVMTLGFEDVEDGEPIVIWGRWTVRRRGLRARPRSRR